MVYANGNFGHRDAAEFGPIMIHCHLETHLKRQKSLSAFVRSGGESRQGTRSDDTSGSGSALDRSGRSTATRRCMAH